MDRRGFKNRGVQWALQPRAARFGFGASVIWFAGLHYPRLAGEFGAWFGTDADCLDYLEWLRWPQGFVCPACGHQVGWRMADDRFRCDRRTSVTAGTIFDKRRTPLTVWITACWLFATQKDGVSAQSLKRALEIGSYQTAWAMLHRLRSVLVRPAASASPAESKSTRFTSAGRNQVCAADGPRARSSWSRWLWRFGSRRGSAVPDGDPGRRVRRLPAPVRRRPRRARRHGDHRRLAGLQRHRRPRLRLRPPQPTRARHRGEDPTKLLPGVHRIASLAKRWLLGTHQGSVDEAHLGAYLDEFVFRFNRRTSRSRGLTWTTPAEWIPPN